MTAFNGVFMSTPEVAARFNELAQQEKWFEIQDELFADDVKSIEPVTSPYFNNAENKKAVRKKGEDWINKIEAVHKLSTSKPFVNNNFIALNRVTDLTVGGFGRIYLEEIMLYEVKNGKIISERFFY